MTRPGFLQLTQSPRLYLLLGILFTGVVIALVYGIAPSFDHRAIGISIAHAQDVSVRGKIHIFSVLSGICYFLAVFLRIGIKSDCQQSNPAPTHHGIILGLILVLNVLLFLYTNNPLFLKTAFALLFLAGVAIYVYRRTNGQYSNDFSWVVVALVYHVLITAYCIWGEVAQFDILFFTLFTLLLVAAFTIAGKIQTKTYNPALWVTISRGLWPLMLLPLSVIVTNEIQYSLSARFGLRVTGLWIWLAVCMSLILIVLGLFLMSGKKAACDVSANASAQEISRLLHTRYLPVILISSAAFSSYISRFDFFMLRDVFHGGESIVPMQQMLEYGTIPYIDFYPPHGLFDLFPQLFYQLINQTPYVESHLWGDGYMSGWIPRAFSALVMYCFLGRYLSYKATFLTIFALPAYTLIHPYYILLVFPALMISDQQKSVSQWMALWGLVVAATLWRVDFGIAATGASLFVLMMWAWSERSFAMLVQGLSALGLVGAATVFLFCVLCIYKGHSPLNVFQQIMDYVVIISTVTSYEKFLGQLDTAAFIQYLFFPLIGVVYAAHFSSRALRHQPLSSLHLVLAYLTVASLVISVRSLNRHSHYEGVFSTYFYFLVLALAALLLPKVSNTVRVALFLTIFVSGYAFLPISKSIFQIIYFNLPGIELDYPAPASARAPTLLAEMAIPDDRLGPTKSSLENTTFFLNHYLQGNQTFYDFTNSPLLYALSHKAVPSYTFETAAHTSDAIQHTVLADLRALYQRDDIPVVLFKQNNDVLDSPDGVATAVRSYRVAEYIYQMYLPCVSIDHYEIWISKNMVGTQNCAEYLRQTWQKYETLPGGSGIEFVPVESSIQTFELLKLPYVWANYGQNNPLQTNLSAQKLNILPQDQDSQQFELILPQQIETDTGNYIHLRVSSEHDAQAELRYAQGNGFTFSIIGNSQPQDYLIRVSSQYAWYEQAIKVMSLSTDAPIKLEFAGLLPGD